MVMRCLQSPVFISHHQTKKKKDLVLLDFDSIDEYVSHLSLDLYIKK